MPAHLTISGTNAAYQKRADKLREMALAGDLDGLRADIGGVNTYAKMLRRYRDLLVIAVEARDTTKAAA